MKVDRRKIHALAQEIAAATLPLDWFDDPHGNPKTPPRCCMAIDAITRILTQELTP